MTDCLECKTVDGNRISASYNFPNKPPLFCSKHKKKGMINVHMKGKRCQDCAKEGKTILACFNFVGKPVLCCLKHKKKEIVNVDIKRRACCDCEKEGKTTTASFNIEGEPPLFCSKHKKKGMENVTKKNKRCIKCKEEGNIVLGCWKKKGKQELYCSKHKKKGMIDITHEQCEHNRQKTTCFECCPNSDRICSSCHKTRVGRYKPYCAPCYFFLNPNIKPIKRYLTKELHLREELRSFLEPYHPFYNTIIPNSCNILCRPDIFIDCGTHLVIIECDEHQHRNYSEICEMKRYNNILFIYGKPAIFIRFNPDSYKGGYEYYQGCFKDDPNLSGGYQVIKNEWEKRIELLKENISMALLDCPKVPLNVIWLFYDWFYV